MLGTHFDAVNKVWSGPNCEITVDKHEHFGEYLFEKLKEDPGLVTQVNNIY